ncbi:MAG: asparagine synthase (glutamine-hydrolyzing) [Acidobacteria bacterium]|nr:asparagine synthase (glutamine-hydrolyzing) [Acidobacteriota bacterium]
MCGICGIAIPDQSYRRVDTASLVAMRDTLVHRGPDDAGILVDRTVGLGHRRLSIVDIGGGGQPMANEDDSIWIAFNGEIYNHMDLRPLLEEAGHRYRTRSDTETILHLYEEFGTLGVRQLRGMFAYAIWDSTRRQIVLSRDRLGIKPLYYVLQDDGTLHFASEIKALIESRAVKPELNYNALADFSTNRCTSGEETLFRGVKRLLPGHTLVWHDGRIRIESYWDVSFTKTQERLSDREYIDRFSDLFHNCVESHLMSDVPLGMFLSGGIDSSAIAAIMSRIVKDPIKTFSVAFAERDSNELEYARLVAQAFKTDHHEIVVSPEQFFAHLPSLVYQEDEPIAHPSSVPLYFVSRLAADHVKVVLTGEGSDELMAGYNKYRVAIYNLILGRSYERFAPGWMRDIIRDAIERLPGASPMRRILQRTFLRLPANMRDVYLDNFAVFSPIMQQQLFANDTYERMTDRDPYRTTIEYIEGSDADSILDKLLAADLKTYLHELLMKQDQMSMAASIESRVPFLDHRLVEFVNHLPVDMKLRGWTTKYILRRSMQDILPKQILTRKKMGFPVPVGNWFRGGFRHVLDDYVLSDRAVSRGIFNRNYVRELVTRHAAGENHSERLWMLVNFEIWHRHFIDGEILGSGNLPAIASQAGFSAIGA